MADLIVVRGPRLVVGIVVVAVVVANRAYVAMVRSPRAFEA